MTPASRIWHLANLMLFALLVLLAGRLLYWQVRAPSLPPTAVDAARSPYAGFGNLPQPVVQRTVALLSGIRRGAFYDRNGQLLAYDEAGPGGVRRVYPEPSVGPVVGYLSGVRTGAAGLERNLNLSLLGLDRLDSQLNQMAHRPVVGSDVVLTIDRATQAAAAQALGGRPGAVVVLDAATGGVLAMASAPSFDPNRALEPGYLAGLVAACGDDPNCPGPLLNRATQGRYTPGSTFKTVTLIAALDSGLATPETVFDFGAPRTDAAGKKYYVYETGGGIIVDYNHRESRLDLTRAYGASANAAFGRLGDELGAERFIDYAQRLGFSSERGAPPLELDTSPAQLAGDLQALADDPFLRASTAIGQGELLASPLNMAVVVAAVVGEGNVPRPHLIREVRAPDGTVVQPEPGGNRLARTMRPATARQVRAMMEAAVAGGSGGAAAVPGLTVGGKTGTAQLGGAEAPHAWFIGFASDGDHTVIIAVVIEHGGSGASVAAPVFAQVAPVAVRALQPRPDAGG